jgi:hypothetical protein
MRSAGMYFETATRRTGDEEEEEEEADWMVERMEERELGIGSRFGSAVDIRLMRFGKTSLRMRC